MEFDPYETSLLVIGLVGLAAATIKGRVKSSPVSMSIVLVGLGMAVFSLIPAINMPDLRSELELTERLTEAGVLISLMAAGLAIDRPIGWARWMPTWRLLAITMPLSIAAGAALGYFLLGLNLASAILLGAVMAPTDPVIADELTVDGPSDGGRSDDDTNLASSILTSEAGLNDALAFPFVYLAVVINDHGVAAASLGEWFARDVLLRLSGGLVIGIVVGRCVAWLAFHNRRTELLLTTTSQGFVALAATLTAYGAAELLHGYGFLSVFIAAVVFRGYERDHEYHRVLHDFSDQLERLIVIGLLVTMGGAFVGGMLEGATFAGGMVAVMLIVVVRPVAGVLATIGGEGSTAERRTIAVYGIRGIGSIYYLAYALQESNFEGSDTLWATVGLTIALSIVFHGSTSNVVRRRLDRPLTGAR